MSVKRKKIKQIFCIFYEHCHSFVSFLFIDWRRNSTHFLTLNNGFHFHSFSLQMTATNQSYQKLKVSVIFYRNVVLSMSFSKATHSRQMKNIAKIVRHDRGSAHGIISTSVVPAFRHDSSASRNTFGHRVWPITIRICFHRFDHLGHMKIDLTSDWRRERRRVERRNNVRDSS